LNTRKKWVSLYLYVDNKPALNLNPYSQLVAYAYSRVHDCIHPSLSL
jgi:hypothetical protein